MNNETKTTAVNEDENLGGRLPLLKPEQLNPEQKELYKLISDKQVPWAKKNNFEISLQDGSLIGPFNFHLRSPAVSKQYLGWANAESAGSKLSPRMREIIILTVGFSCNAEYEAYAHTAVGKAVGLTDAIINSIKLGQQPENLEPNEIAIYQFTHQLVNNRRIDDPTYQTAIKILTEQGVVDIVHLIGAYLATSAFLNAFQVPAPKK
ncbi:MAG: carboxymuconolactone decarboxylase family protein [Mucilaginibacter sp.]|uniref:carboxymuconolactone decarboxylase family protein n=1 Tax=Mucilaginibacter sp. TaxID=1882438 RepID=UPI0034E59C37